MNPTSKYYNLTTWLLSNHVELEFDNDVFFREDFTSTLEGFVFYVNGNQEVNLEECNLATNKIITINPLNSVGKLDELGRFDEMIFKYFNNYDMDYTCINRLPNCNFEFNSDWVDSFKSVSPSSLIKEKTILSSLKKHNFC
jgi:hypothetical protein